MLLRLKSMQMCHPLFVGPIIVFLIPDLALFVLNNIILVPQISPY